MKSLKNKFIKMISWLQEGMYAVSSVYSQKGLGILKTPVIVLILGPILVWILLYKPAHNSYVKKTRLISSIQAQKRYGAAFVKLKNELSQKENVFVKADTPGWLSSFIRETCAKENVIIRSMTDQQETDIGKHYIKATINFSFFGSFEKAVNVIVALENSPYFMRLSQVDFTKSPSGNDLARVSVTITAETIVAKEKTL